MRMVSIDEATTHFAALLSKLEAEGDTVVICRNGVPIADLAPHKPLNRTQTHPVLSKIEINYAPVEPLTNNEWPEAATPTLKNTE